MGLLLDEVPNHMAASHENPWWMDVLENGPASRYAKYFDIDWQPAAPQSTFLQENRVLLPVLGDFYGDTLERGELTVHLDENGLFLRYYERRFPLDPQSYDPILEVFEQRFVADLGPEHSVLDELRRARSQVRQMPARTPVDADAAERRQTLAKQIKETLFAVYRDHLEARLSIDAALREMGGTQGQPTSFDLLDRILGAQAWRLAHWKVAFEKVNYRRFFDINDLVCLRVEDPEVFQARHAALMQLIRAGKVTGLRIDHVDGLHDPRQYLSRLQSSLDNITRQVPFFVVVEKILGRDEALAPDWAVCGTTGYDFLGAVNDVFIDPGGLCELERIYEKFTGESTPFAEICYARNQQVMRELFAGEVNTLGHYLGELAAQDRHACDIPLADLTAALAEITACLPVYRTYVQEFEISASDRKYLQQTLDVARQRTSQSPQAFEFLRRVLLLDAPDHAIEQKEQWLRFVIRWQKFTGPVMAKGLEDTASYVHHSLLSRNEVGGDPLREKPPYSLDELHALLNQRLKDWPGSLNASSTHDTKRSEDVRARINVLSELANEWEQHFERWSAANAEKKILVNGLQVPSAAEEVLIYQTLVGAWPLDPQEEPEFFNRLKAFLLKALREGKTHSGWLHPDESYEGAVFRFVDAILAHSEENRFLTDFLPFVERIACHGALNSLSQVLLKITAPGVPDIYQGTELWDFSLTDPDNRRPVDFHKRAALLEDVRRRDLDDRENLLQEVASHWKDGRIKLYLTAKSLDFRRAHADVFLKGEYFPLEASGPLKDCVIAFARRLGDQYSLTIAVRWTTRLGLSHELVSAATWSDTSVLMPKPAASSSWRNVITGERIASISESGRPMIHLRDVFRQFPVALLASEPEASG